jgi:hypothetical protein
LLRQGGTFVERFTSRRCRAGNLVDQHGSGDTASPRDALLAGQGRIVRHDNGTDGNPVNGRRSFRRYAKIQTIARVILNDYQNARGGGGGSSARWDRMPGDGLNAGQNGSYARTRKDTSTNGGRQHSLTNPAGVTRFVSAAASGNQLYLRRRALGGEDDLLFLQAPQVVRVLQQQAVDKVFDGIVRIVDNLLGLHHGYVSKSRSLSLFAEQEISADFLSRRTLMVK